MKKIAKILTAILLTPIVLFVILTLLFYFPPFQNWAVKQFSAYASEATGMEISVRHVNLSFPLNLVVDDVLATKTSNSVSAQNDTIAKVKQLELNIQMLPLLHSNVEVDALQLTETQFCTSDFITSAIVKGRAHKLLLNSHGINLNKESVTLNHLLLKDADVDIMLTDSVSEDTTENKVAWTIALKDIQIENTRLMLRAQNDSLRTGLLLSKATLSDGFVDLGNKKYSARKFNATARQLAYNKPFEPLTTGFDINHITMPELSLSASNIKADTLSVELQQALLSTPHSSLGAKVYLPFAALNETNTKDTLRLQLDGSIGRQYIIPLLADTPKAFRDAWPHYPLTLTVGAEGCISNMWINELALSLPTAFDLKLNGHATNVLDENMRAECKLHATTHNLNFITQLLPRDTRSMLRLPHMTIDGQLSANGNVYAADVDVLQGGGKANVSGHYNARSMSYDAQLSTKAFPLNNFLPNQGITPLTLQANVTGQGTDVFSRHMQLSATAEINHLQYSDIDLNNSKVTARIANGRLYTSLDMHNEMLDGEVSVDALMSRKSLRATLACSLNDWNMHRMGIVKVPLNTAFCAHVDVASDMKDFYSVEGILNDITIRDSARVFRPRELVLDILTRTDTTKAKVYTGDFHLDMEASGGYRRVMHVANNLADELMRQARNKHISQDSLMSVLPEGHLVLKTGRENFVSAIAGYYNMQFAEINANIQSSPHTGLNGYVQADSTVVSGFLLDNIHLDLSTENNEFRYAALIQNYKKNPQYCFRMNMDGRLLATGSTMGVSIYDADDVLAIRMGLRGELIDDGIRLSLTDQENILGYRTFTANKDNYFLLKDDNRISARIILKADDGTGLQVYTDDNNLEALQDITIGVHHLDLSPIVSNIPYFPRIDGTMNGDFHVIQTTEKLSVSTSLEVDKFRYEGCDMGNLATEFVYIPEEDGSHYVDGMLMHDGQEIGTIKGTYRPDENDDVLDAKMTLAHLPLDLINGFVPNQIAGLKGTADGVLDVHGPLSSLNADGELYLQSAYLFSQPYGMQMRFDDRPVTITKSRVVLDDFSIYSTNNQAMKVNGLLDFHNLNAMQLNVALSARNYLLIDAKRNRRSEAYGKAYVNVDATAVGRIDALKVKGKVDVLGNTDLTYILRDSPLTTDNRLEELVKFTDFSDETPASSTERPAIEGLSMDMMLSIAQGAHIMCALNTSQTNYVDIIGGGDLRMIYKDGEIGMKGRYTLNSGEMKYSLPVIPLKTFTIRDGSYVEFNGDIMNPTLNIVATEQLKTNVTSEGMSRQVLFNCGVIITKTLKDMGLQFLVEAPEDMTMDGQLQTMSVEERGKIAVTMLTTGMYLTDSNMSSLSMNSALSSFLQSEINNITGNALRSLDLSIGMDNADIASGRFGTDYSFKFAKRFWNNRIAISVGGKVNSTQAEYESLFDNVSLEYRLDQAANANLKLFYDRQVYDYLEGYVGEYGVGLVWKKRAATLKDFLPFNTNKKILKKTIEQKTDSMMEKGGNK